MAITTDEIRKYNEKLNECRQKKVKLETELEVSKREIDKLCAELSNELGITVNQDNIGQIYREYMEKLENKVKSGMEILNRIESENL